MTRKPKFAGMDLEQWHVGHWVSLDFGVKMLLSGN
ncbi:integrase [Klebsiella aerogenes]|nr:integrase [Klebsiella aerogenes]